MVLLGALLLIGLIAGLVWLSRYAWGSKGSGWPEVAQRPAPARRDRTPSEPRIRFVPSWQLIALAGVLGMALLVVSRGRAFPILLFIPLVFALRQNRCRSCGQMLSPRAEACASCGAPRPGR